MIEVLFYVLCYLTIGILLQMVPLLIFKLFKVPGMRISDAINEVYEYIYHSDYGITEEDVDELYNIRKAYLWINILLWPFNILVFVYYIIQVLLEKVFRA